MPHTMIDDALAERIAAELLQLEPIVIELSGMQAFQLIGQLQLALRHPHNCGPSAAWARSVCLKLISDLPTEAARLGGMGFDSRHDMYCDGR